MTKVSWNNTISCSWFSAYFGIFPFQLNLNVAIWWSKKLILLFPSILSVKFKLVDSILNSDKTSLIFVKVSL